MELFKCLCSKTFAPQLLRGLVFNVKIQIHDVVSISLSETDAHMRYNNIIFSSENKRSDLITHKARGTRVLVVLNNNVI